MSKRKITQDDLRKMMGEIKSSKAGTGPPSKKYKLSSRELALLEEQKREEERKKLKEREKKAAALASLPPPDAVPTKSILKNKIVPSTSTYRPTMVSVPKVASLEPEINSSKASSETENNDSVQKEAADEFPQESDAEGKGNLPEGFFDDPVMDAKARNVQYVDTAEEEWERFQKEMADEMNVAQDILVEDRIEATIDRQIEEIDDQLKAWSRVAQMEKKKDETVKELHKNGSKTERDQPSDSEDSDFEEFLDWRKKK